MLHVDRQAVGSTPRKELQIEKKKKNLPGPSNGCLFIAPLAVIRGVH